MKINNTRLFNEIEKQIKKIDNQIDINEEKAKNDKIQVNDNKYLAASKHTVLLNRFVFKQNNNFRNIFEFLLYLSRMNFKSQQKINIFTSIFILDKEVDIQDMIIQRETYQNSIQNIGIYSKTIDTLTSTKSFDITELQNQLNIFSKTEIQLRTSSKKM